MTRHSSKYPTLDPTLDVVFKMLFVRNPELLIDLLEAVLHPDVPIASVEVLNPDLPKNIADDRGAILDIHAKLADGIEVDIEMQVAGQAVVRKRALYYWARLYANQLKTGDNFDELRPCRVVFFLAYQEGRDPCFHSVAKVSDAADHTEFCGDLEIHLIRLPKVKRGRNDRALRDWAQFFRAKTDAVRRRLAMSNPVFAKAKRALDELSADVKAQEAARERDLAWVNHRLNMGAAKKEGRVEGRVQGLIEGRAEELRVAIVDLCEAYNIECSDEQRDALRAMSLSALRTLKSQIKANRAWK